MHRIFQVVEVALVLSLGAGCAAGVLPPSRTDVASTVIADGGHMTSGLRFTTGAHLASATIRSDMPLDVGAGYVYERVGRPPGSSQTLALTGGSSGEMSDEPPDVVEAHGGYLEVAHTLQRGRGHRSWLGARGELLARQTPIGRRAAAGAYARIAWELYSPGQGAGSYTDGCGGGAGFAYGSVGLGLFIESGAQWTESERAAFVATAGLSLRLPLIGGFAFDLCPHC